MSRTKNLFDDSESEGGAIYDDSEEMPPATNEKARREWRETLAAKRDNGQGAPPTVATVPGNGERRAKVKPQAKTTPVSPHPSMPDPLAPSRPVPVPSPRPAVSQPPRPPLNLRRQRRDDDDDDKPVEPKMVSAGPAGLIADYICNPTDESYRRVSNIDRMQAWLLPQLDLTNTLIQNCFEIAYFRKDPALYRKLFKKERPDDPNLLGEFGLRTAQWQMSIQGGHVKDLREIAMVEKEGKDGDDMWGHRRGDSRWPE